MKHGKSIGIIICTTEMMLLFLLLIVIVPQHTQSLLVFPSTPTCTNNGIEQLNDFGFWPIICTSLSSLSSPLVESNQQHHYLNQQHHNHHNHPSLEDLSLWNSLLLANNNKDDQTQENNKNSNNINDDVLLLKLKSNRNDLKLVRDQVVRVLDPNTIRLKKVGLVSLAAVRTPVPGSSGNIQYPECFAYSPTYKIKQLLPANSNVLVVQPSSSTTTNKPIIAVGLIRTQDQLIVNRELVRTGFARVRLGPNPIQELLPSVELQSLQADAQSKGLGLFQRCDDNDDDENQRPRSIVAEFEPLELTVQTQWGDDGGKQVLKRKETITQQGPPPNPGDTKGCSDFETYEDALRWFERYQPWYGDVARLDRNGDGIPCPGLPHTTVQDRYRMKIPTQRKILPLPTTTTSSSSFH